jgi:hypothetical protein
VQLLRDLNFMHFKGVEPMALLPRTG